MKKKQKNEPIIEENDIMIVYLIDKQTEFPIGCITRRAETAPWMMNGILCMDIQSGLNPAKWNPAKGHWYINI